MVQISRRSHRKLQMEDGLLLPRQKILLHIFCQLGYQVQRGYGIKVCRQNAYMISTNCMKSLQDISYNRGNTHSMLKTYVDAKNERRIHYNLLSPDSTKQHLMHQNVQITCSQLPLIMDYTQECCSKFWSANHQVSGRI